MNGLARMPDTTGKAKYVRRGRDLVADGHKDQTVAILQVREVFVEAVTDRVDFAIRGKGGLDGFVRHLDGQITHINSDNLNTRRCNRDFSVLKKNKSLDSSSSRKAGSRKVTRTRPPRRNCKAEILLACNARTNKGHKSPTPRDKYTSDGKCRMTLNGNRSAMEINFAEETNHFPRYYPGS